jgi:hypothetical protein
MISARRAGMVGAALVALLAAGCASVTDGRGSADLSGSRSASSSRPDFPSTSVTPSTPSSSEASTTAPTPTPSPTPQPITNSQREEVLVTTSGGQDVSVLVAVPGGYEAATYDQRGHVRFWFDPVSSLRWRLIGTSRYPYVPQIGPPGAESDGRLLRYMRHATFIITGQFTGDGSGNAVAFTTGARGWGVIKAKKNGNIGPSGRPVGRDQIGLSYGFAFSGGYLVTADCSLDRPISDCDTHPVVKRWVWTGSDFRRVR